ncbi:MAG: DUF2499 domain-containing protein [Synechococcales cyanobacterium]
MYALSLPTWWIHTASVVEWMVAMALVWQFARVSGHRAWRWLAWAMIPALVSAMCAITWHIFDNDPALAGLVTLQAAMTVVGNTTLALAAYWIWRQEQVG